MTESLWESQVRSGTLEDDEIRILNILPGEGKEPLRCKLERRQRTDPSPYKALSYVWGDQIEQSNLSVNDTECYVGRNLGDAILTLRNPRIATNLWVDAICINQHDVNERNRQVRRMGDIYASAEEVFIWLGKSVGPYSTLKDARDLILNMKALTAEQRRSKYHAYRDVFGYDWFSRLWVLQEAVLAQKATFILGDEQCDLDAFRQSDWDSILMPVRENSDLEPESANLNVARNLHIFRKLMNLVENRKGTKTVGYEQLVYDGTLRRCSDPRDHIFGVAGIAQFFGWETQRVDYTKSTSEVFYEFAKSTFIKEPQMLLSFSSRAANETPDWPSWVPDLAAHSRRTEFHHHMYTAGTSIAKCLTPDAFDDREKLLFLDGVIFDTVRSYCYPDVRLLSSLDHGSEDLPLLPFREYCSLAEEFWQEQPASQSPYGDQNEQHQARWRTLVGNVYHQRPPVSAWTATKVPDDDTGHTFERIMDHQSYQMPTTSTESVTSRIPPATSIFLWSINTMVSGRYLFTTRQGHYGVGPKGLAVDDTIIIAAGLRMPLAVRKSPDSRIWKYIGPVYVHGVMYGEALTQDHEDKLERFAIG